MTMSKYDARETNMKRLPEIVAAIAETLGEGWSVDRREEYAHVSHLAGPNDVRLSVTVGWDDPSKLQIHGSLPQRRDVDFYGLKMPSIGVGIDRGGEVAAREIRRRLLDGVEAVMVDARKQIATAEAQQDRAKNAAAVLAEIFGPGSVRERDGRGGRPTYSVYADAARVEIRESGSIEIDRIVGDVNELAPVLRALAELAAKQKQSKA